MTHEQNEVHLMIDDFKHYGLSQTQAMFATMRVIQARCSEALLNAPSGSRFDYWSKAMDYLQNIVDNTSYEAVHNSTR